MNQNVDLTQNTIHKILQIAIQLLKCKLKILVSNLLIEKFKILV